MMNFFTNIFDTGDFPARWDCGNWSDAHGWLHILSDIGVWSAYLAIPLVLGYFALQKRDLPFRRVVWLFGAFILACGTTHLMEAIIFWWPAYRLAGGIKLFTAIVSWATVFALVPIVPALLSLRSPRELEREIAERKRVESELQIAYSDLEQRVQARTADLARLNVSLEQEVRERQAANRMKDEFLSNLSHELRTPLTAILGWSQLLRTGKVSSEDQKRGIDTIERNAMIQTRIIEDLLDISRIISGKLRLEIQSCSLLEVIEDSVAAIAPAVEAKQITVQQIFDTTIGNFQADPARLQQIVWNLLSNAVKFTPRDGKIQIRLERVNSHIEIVVADNGSGIASEFLPYVFDRFRQEDSTTKRHVGGLGLGLSIVRQLVEMHGGSVSCHSDGPGHGATFVVKLPRTPTHPDRQTGSHEHPHYHYSSTDLAARSPDLLRGVKVLVVDDEADARQLIQRVLELSQAQVQTAGSAFEALELLKNFRPHVLLSDIGLPERDGYDLIRELRVLHSAKEIPAIALTAFARSEDRQRSLLAGFQMHVAKPINPTELTLVVASLVGQIERKEGVAG